jgi:hypothetical protein
MFSLPTIWRWGCRSLRFHRIAVGVSSAILLLSVMSVARANICVFPDDLMSKGNLLFEAGLQQSGFLWLNECQNRLPEASPEWWRWERLRLPVLVKQKKWLAVVNRPWPPPSTEPVAIDSASLRVDAFLSLGKGALARQQLQSLVWRKVPSKESLSQWRVQLIKSYVLDGKYQDAATALSHYRRDYTHLPLELAVLDIRLILRDSHFKKAKQRLIQQLQEKNLVVSDLWGLPGDFSLLLLLWLEIELKQQGALSVVSQQTLKKWLASQKGDLALQGWRLMAMHAEGQNHIDLVIVAKERALVFFDSQRMSQDFSATALWETYRYHARRLGNQHQLLEGDDAGWLALANTLGDNNPALARAVWALLVLESNDRMYRQQGYDRLSESLQTVLDGNILLSRLHDSEFLNDKSLVSTSSSKVDAVQSAVETGSQRTAIMASELLLDQRLTEAKYVLRLGLEQVSQDADIRVWFLPLQLLLQSGDSANSLRGLSALFSRAKESTLKSEISYEMAEVYTHQKKWLEALMSFLRSAQLNSQVTWQQLVQKKIMRVLSLGGFKHDLKVMMHRGLSATDWLSSLSEAVPELAEKSDLPIFPVVMLPVFLD